MLLAISHAVFDTDVIVSDFLAPTRPPGRMVEQLRNRNVQAVLDHRMC